MNQTMTTLIY